MLLGDHRQEHEALMAARCGRSAPRGAHRRPSRPAGRSSAGTSAPACSWFRPLGRDDDLRLVGPPDVLRRPRVERPSARPGRARTGSCCRLSLASSSARLLLDMLLPQLSIFCDRPPISSSGAAPSRSRELTSSTLPSDAPSHCERAENRRRAVFEVAVVRACRDGVEVEQLDQLGGVGFGLAVELALVGVGRAALAARRTQRNCRREHGRAAARAIR